MLPSRAEILKSILFKTSRSGGKGGQNVNKVSSKVELIFNLQQAEYFTDEEKHRIHSKLQNRLDSEGLLHIISQEDRSQLSNKEKALDKLINILELALVVQKKRKPTKIPKAIVQKRLKNKSLISELKANRRKPNLG